MTTIKATVVADSIRPEGIRLTTMKLKYPYIIHGELMTHRVFCLAGDARLDFDLPVSAQGVRRVYSMSLREFSDKWHNGAAEGNASRHNGHYLDDLDEQTVYSAREIAKLLGFQNNLNLNQACRDGLVVDASKSHSGRWRASGLAWKQWRRSTGRRRFSIRQRLAGMHIRQVNEITGSVQNSTVLDCVNAGPKPVFRVSAGHHSTVSTDDHRILTSSGWKRVGDLVVGQDAACVYRYGAGGNEEDPYKKIDGVWVASWARKVRHEVAARQNHLCAQTSEPLEPSFHIHHIVPRHQRPDLAFDLDNVLAVNPDAHRQLHESQGWQVGVALTSQFTIVDSVTAEGEQDTYDLEIGGEFPNFFC